MVWEKASYPTSRGFESHRVHLFKLSFGDV